MLLFDLVFILCYAELQHSKGEASRHHDIALYETSRQCNYSSFRHSWYMGALIAFIQYFLFVNY